MENNEKMILKNDIKQKTKFLIDLGLDKRKIRIILDENEDFLKTNLIDISKNIDILREKVKNLKIKIILEETPKILTLDKEDLVKKIELLDRLLTKRELEEVVNYHSYLFEYNYEHLKGIMKIFYKNNLIDNILDVIIFKPEIFEMSPEEIDIDELKI